MRGGGTLKAPAFTLAEGATHLAMLNSQRRFGFTLAEVLVTLGIIGVVSAMTVPSLIQNHQRSSYAVSAHKVYNEMQQALTQYLTDNNSVGINETGLTNADLDNSVLPFMKKYFKVVNDCGDKTTPCFANNYKSLSGTSITAGRKETLRCVTIASGASICMQRFTGDSDTGFGYIYVDTNGPKGPNIGCRDYWRMFYFSDASVDGYRLSPGCKKDGTKCPNGGTLQAQREYDWSAGCGDPNDPEDIDGIGRLIGNGWVMDY